MRVDGFWIHRHEVTNSQFRQFVDATGYRTLAERRGLDPKTLIPKCPGKAAFQVAVLIQPTERGGKITQWWQYLAGANWRQPAGPGSSIAGKDNHPVVHVAFEDAHAYAQWRGRSPPEWQAQWELAALGASFAIAFIFILVATLWINP